MEKINRKALILL